MQSVRGHSMTYAFCAGCSPSGPCCCGIVPDAAGEEQLERDGLEVGPQRVRNKCGEKNVG